MFNQYLITIDIDWAPDFAIDKMAEVLIHKNLKATWFVTHPSPAVERLKARPDLFELGIHPNFLPGSTQGTSFREIMDYVMRIVPQACSMRTHALVQSSILLRDILQNYPITIDCSLFLRESKHIEPHLLMLSDALPPILRLPFFWEDDLESYNRTQSWEFSSWKYNSNGLKIFNFHPIYVYLNIDTMHQYERLKTVKPLFELSPADVDPFIHKGEGAGTFFASLTSFIPQKQKESYLVKDFTFLFREEHT